VGVLGLSRARSSIGTNFKAVISYLPVTVFGYKYLYLL